MVRSSYGEMDLDIIRVRNGDHDPIIVKKEQSDIRLRVMHHNYVWGDHVGRKDIKNNR